jgi:hypothetical protein
MPQSHLRQLPLGARYGLVLLCLVLIGGFGASFAHLVWHHENRDERPGLTLEDIRGAYHGIQTTSPIKLALERNHPDTLSPANRKALLDWLGSPRIAEDYDSLDKGDAAPAEIIKTNCLSCHGRAAASTPQGTIARTVPLDYWDDIKPIAFSRKVDPNSVKVLAASTHTHALSLGTLTIVIGALLCLTALPRRLTGVICFFSSLGLLADFAGWWLARDYDAAVYAIVVGGGAYNSMMMLALVVISADAMWRPPSTSSAV